MWVRRKQVSIAHWAGFFLTFSHAKKKAQVRSPTWLELRRPQHCQILRIAPAKLFLDVLVYAWWLQLRQNLHFYAFLSDVKVLTQEQGTSVSSISLRQMLLQLIWTQKIATKIRIFNILPGLSGGSLTQNYWVSSATRNDKKYLCAGWKVSLGFLKSVSETSRINLCQKYFLKTIDICTYVFLLACSLEL